MASASRPSSESEGKRTYAEVVKKSPLHNSYWRRFQKEDEDDAIAIALKKSVEEQKVSVHSRPQSFDLFVVNFT